jgi:probable HAF family extracellular repeat protein
MEAFMYKSASTLVGILASGFTSAAPVFNLQEIPNPVASSRFVSSVTGVNDSGTVVGSTRIGDGVSRSDPPERAFSWTPGKGFTGLGTFNRSDLSTYSAANGINSKGIVVGEVWVDFYQQRQAVKWVSGKIQALPKWPGETGSVAVAINTLGTIVGYSNSFTTANSRAVLWNADGIMSLGINPEPLEPGATSSAYAINASGFIVGNFDTDGDFDRMFIWSPNTGKKKELPSRPEYGNAALAINGSRVVVGTSGGDGVLWSGSPYQLKILVDVPDPTDDGGQAHVTGIADNGDMIGDRGGGYGGIRYLWRGGTRYRLDRLMDPTNPLTSCVKLNTIVISPKGKLAAIGLNVCSGENHLYILIPTT